MARLRLIPTLFDFGAGECLLIGLGDIVRGIIELIFIFLIIEMWLTISLYFVVWIFVVIVMEGSKL